MTDYLNPAEPLKNRLQQILSRQNLETQRAQIDILSTGLGVDSLACAAALLHLLQALENPAPPAETPQLPANTAVAAIKMVRYRLDVGSNHQITLEQLKKVLIEESGVDKNNINNVNIHNLYTLIELPDEMPPDIFQHLKTVEINQHKLDIRRVKTHHKKRGNNYIRRGRKRDVKAGSEQPDPAKSAAKINKTVD